MRDRKNMATARKAYTSEFYAYNYAPERQPERVRRTRQRPEVNTESREQKNKREQAYTAAVLRSLIVAVVAVGILFIGIVVVNAQAAKLQYSINQLRSENSTIQTEIDMLTIKLDGSKTINQLESYATEELGMYYPQGSECIHLSAIEPTDGSLADVIKQKAYE